MHPILYDIATTVAAPVAHAAIACSKRYHPLRGRFRPALAAPLDKPIWVHACSIGELNAATPLIRAIQARWTARPILVTVSTVSAHPIALETFGADHLAWFPVDAPHITRAAVNAFDPAILLLVETELWPNLIRAVHDHKVPIAIVNGRISKKHFPRMQKMGTLAQRMMDHIDLVIAQSEEHAERFQALGLKNDRLRISSNIKFDAVASNPTAEASAKVGNALGDDPSPLLVFGSTRPGDEAFALETWNALRADYPDLRLVIAPRHIQRGDEIEKILTVPVYRRSRAKDNPAPKDSIILVDTFGELIAWYARATIAVVGGSWFPGVEGHNPLEPAALGTPTVFGPYMGNFREATDRLVEAGGAIQVSSPDGLATELAGLLADSPGRCQLAERGKSTIESARGTINRTLEIIESANLTDIPLI